MWNALILVLVEMPKFQFVQPNPIHSQTLLSRAFGLFLRNKSINIPEFSIRRFDTFSSKHSPSRAKAREGFILYFTFSDLRSDRDSKGSAR